MLKNAQTASATKSNLAIQSSTSSFALCQTPIYAITINIHHHHSLSSTAHPSKILTAVKNTVSPRAEEHGTDEIRNRNRNRNRG